MRDFKSPQYKMWRRGVYRRDRFQCQFPGCKQRRRKLNAHHIRPVSLYPELEFVIENGITLCQDPHHKLVTGQESCYIELFTRIVQGKRKNFNKNYFKILGVKYGYTKRLKRT